MRTISVAPAAPQGIAGPSWALATLKHWWMAYLTGRIEQTAIARLRSMSDYELKDIGLTRSQITFAVRSDAARYY
jgi:uncharacterized protein YjiS (DUF1127 family)